MRYLVTGATGFIGGRLVRQLLEAGHDVVALVRRPDAARPLAALGAQLAAGDVTAPDSLVPAMRGADGVFHLAGWYKIGVRDKRPGYRINVEGTRNVLETMRDLGIAKGVYTSSLAVFSDTHGKVPDETYRYTGPHLSEYDRTKWLAHYEVAEPLMRAGLPLVIVQPGATYGPGDPSQLGQTLRRYARGKLPFMPAGTAFCWGYVDDVARGHLLAMERGHPGESYIISGPPCSLEAVLQVAQHITGIEAPCRKLSPRLMRFMAAVMAVAGAIVPLPEMYAPETLRVSAGVTYLGSDAKARRELGFTVRSLEDGLRQTFG